MVFKLTDVQNCRYYMMWNLHNFLLHHPAGITV